MNTPAKHSHFGAPPLPAPHSLNASIHRTATLITHRAWRNATRALLALLFAATGSALAGPAPWYLWRSKVDCRMVCAQTSLGTGWERALGPFSDSRCAKSAIVK